jgi:hypothetical protein
LHQNARIIVEKLEVAISAELRFLRFLQILRFLRFFYDFSLRFTIFTKNVLVLLKNRQVKKFPIIFLYFIFAQENCRFQNIARRYFKSII